MELPKVIGRYQIREPLAAGGMGVLYLAFDPSVDRLVAVKVLRADDPDIRVRFLREARLVARLQHPNIVTIFEAGEHNGQPYMVMEYLSGETLERLIRRGAPIDLAAKLRLIIDVCAGLAHAHSSGIIHRDVKPANVMVSNNSQTVKLLDFGIARGDVSGLTLAGTLMGTIAYMSPEQVQGLAVDHRSDIFSLAVVLYELLVCRRPFKGDTDAAVMHKILSETPTAITAIDPALPPELVGIFERALAKTAEARYQDVSEMRGDLARLYANLDEAAGEHTFIRRLRSAAPSVPASTPLPLPDRKVLAQRRSARLTDHLRVAEQALEQGKLQQALTDVELAAEIDPDDPRVGALHQRVRQAVEGQQVARWISEADRHLAAGMLEAAGDAIRQAAAISADHPDVRAAAARLDLAQVEAERAREQERRTTQAMDRARRGIADGALDEALKAALEAKSYAPGDENAAALLASVRQTIERGAAETVEAARRDIAGGRFADAKRRLEAFTPSHPEIDRALVDLRAASAEVDRQREEGERQRKATQDALQVWVASTVETLVDALDRGRWEVAIESVNALTLRAPSTPGLGQWRARAQRGLEAASRAAEFERAARAAEAERAARAAEAAEAENAARVAAAERAARAAEAERAARAEEAERAARAAEAEEHAARAAEAEQAARAARAAEAERATRAAEVERAARAEEADRAARAAEAERARRASEEAVESDGTVPLPRRPPYSRAVQGGIALFVVVAAAFGARAAYNAATRPEPSPPGVTVDPPRVEVPTRTPAVDPLESALNDATAMLGRGDTAGALTRAVAGLRTQANHQGFLALVRQIVEQATRRANDARLRADAEPGASARPEYRAASADVKQSQTLGPKQAEQAVSLLDRAARAYDDAATQQRATAAAGDLKKWETTERQAVADLIKRRNWDEAERRLDGIAGRVKGAQGLDALRTLIRNSRAEDALHNWAESRRQTAESFVKTRQWDSAQGVVDEIRGKAPNTPRLAELQALIDAGRKADAPKPTPSPTATPAGGGRSVEPARGTGSATPDAAALAKQEIQKVLQEFGRAYELESIAEIRKVWPDISGTPRDRLEQFFRGYEQIKWVAQQPEWSNLDAERAVVKVSVTTTQAPIRDRRNVETSHLNFQFTLVRSPGSGWRIRGAEWQVVPR